MTNLPASATTDQLLDAYAKAVTRGTTHTVDVSVLLHLLLLRDRIARKLNEESVLDHDLVQKVILTDSALQRQANQIVRIITHERLVGLREARQPPDTSWWWRLDERALTSHVFLAPLTGLALVAALAFGLITILQLSRIGVNVADFSAILAVILPLLAGTALTTPARTLMNEIFSYRRVPLQRQPWVRLALAGILLAVAIYFFWSLPERALQLNNDAIVLQQHGDLAAAIDRYHQAVQLKPSYAEAYYNLGTAYEDAQRFDDATEAYKTAYSLGGDLQVLNNLARVHLAARNDPLAALRLLDPAIRALGTSQQALEHVRADTLYALYKNRGWALLRLGLLGEAGDDLRRSLALQPDGAAAHCLLAQWYEAPENKDAATESAQQHWEQCIAFGSVNYNPPEPEWLALARERLRHERQP